jgi:gliding motility associated protien GldN
MKVIFVNILFLFISLNLFSQGKGNKEIGPSNIVQPMNSSTYPGVVDGVYTKKDVLAKKRAIPYEFVRENDYVWGKRTWSYIDLREKINHPLYYPLEDLDSIDGTIKMFSQGRYSLYVILSQAVRKQEIWGFYDNKKKDPGAFVFEDWSNGDAFQYPCRSGNKYKDDSDELVSSFTISEKIEKSNGQDPITLDPLPVFHLKGVASVDTKVGTEGEVDVFDPLTETMDSTQAEKYPNTILAAKVDYRIKTPEFVQPKSIIKYVLKEDWFFDKERSILDVRTIGLAPVVYDKTLNDGSGGERIHFWVYFPQARDVLKNYYVYDAKSTVGGNTFDHLFMTRRFNAVVYKESTLYDRKIEDYRFGADALYESEKVKNTIRTFEHDVWNF